MNPATSIRLTTADTARRQVHGPRCGAVQRAITRTPVDMLLDHNADADADERSVVQIEAFFDLGEMARLLAGDARG